MDRPRGPARRLPPVGTPRRAHPRPARRGGRRRRLPARPQPVARRPPHRHHSRTDGLGRRERLSRPDGRHRLLPGPGQRRTGRHADRQVPRTHRPLARTDQPARALPHRDRPGSAHLLRLPAVQHERVLPARHAGGGSGHGAAELLRRRLVRRSGQRHPGRHRRPRDPPGPLAVDQARRFRQRHPHLRLHRNRAQPGLGPHRPGPGLRLPPPRRRHRHRRQQRRRGSRRARLPGRRRQSLRRPGGGALPRLPPRRHRRPRRTRPSRGRHPHRPPRP
uniref:Uncharacterized protein n=1 Tax=Streptomyces auratus AGR0001 TaxID=1160718 RepID=J1ZYH4_9ACTN